ncbi:MAG: hypothetical protein IKZ00_08705, partial [Bacteroidaceae bacterium]|nr:hypothetical protein [Bacteroidaceae bacterium]
LWRIQTKHGMILLQEMFKKHPHNQYFLVRGACFYHEKVRTLDYKGVRTGILCGFEFYRTAINSYELVFLPSNPKTHNLSKLKKTADIV